MLSVDAVLVEACSGVLCQVLMLCWLTMAQDDDNDDDDDELLMNMNSCMYGYAHAFVNMNSCMCVHR